MVNRTRRFAQRKKRCARSRLLSLPAAGARTSALTRRQNAASPPNRAMKVRDRCVFATAPGVTAALPAGIYTFIGHSFSFPTALIQTRGRFGVVPELKGSL